MILWTAVELYFTVVLFVFNFTQFVILKDLSILDLALSEVKLVTFRALALRSDEPKKESKVFGFRGKHGKAET